MEIRNSKPMWLIAVMPLTCLLFSFQAYAQWSTDPAVNNPICVEIDPQNSSRMVSDGNGGAIITWWDYNPVLTANDIYAQRISSDGVIQWTVNGVAVCTNDFYQQNPEITSDGNGGAIITWVDIRNGNWEIFAQRIDPLGVVQWTADGVPVGGQESDYVFLPPAIISDGSGGAIIAWEEYREVSPVDPPVREIYAQKINADGVVQWDPASISLNSYGGCQSLKMISDGSGGAIITWDHYIGDPLDGNSDIYVQKVTSDGSVAWTDGGVVLCSLTSLQEYPEIISGGAGSAIIVWKDARNVYYTSLYAQKVDSDGVICWMPDGVDAVPSSGSAVEQKLLSDGNGGTFITWRSIGDFAYAQRINSNGVYQWTSAGIMLSDQVGQRFPQIVTDGSFGAIISWWDYKRNGDIFAQRVDSSGNKLWVDSGACVSVNPFNQDEMQMISDGNGGAILAWTDYRSYDTNSTDIYAQRINGNGILGNVTGVDEKKFTPPAGFMLKQNYPNPFITETRIDFTVNRSGPVTLKVYNTDGKEASILLDKDMAPGNHSVIFDATGLAGGVYYYTLKLSDESDTRSMILLK